MKNSYVFHFGQTNTLASNKRSRCRKCHRRNFGIDYGGTRPRQVGARVDGEILIVTRIRTMQLAPD